ncbi:bacteriocin ABC transporter bacteriocin-binding protein [Clostridium putrefaciens]|uniref:Bacteriocin ABC transporter bacteriocin-binding protein n=1 Tax=Clostridium putrefaciens TaxID=99675 RepID=A0A381J7M0_9CLOT|nr:HlyD family efflux transporter periplasmic adaptor subunit [Clostridium putrefaciens]SUY46973.1 bacteriocin ABC transporter bacteriocin-binding protein [Clostridium putrefaciens]
MKFVVQDIKDITDSRELLESKPHHFTSIFIYLVLTIICSALVWCWFSEKELVVKTSGIVRPSEEIYKVANMATSKVESISFKNGQVVKLGDILYTLEHTEIDLQKKSIEEKAETLKQDVENLKKLKKCILDDKNYFDKNNEKEKDYYNKYLNYEKGNSLSLSDSNSIEDAKNDLNSKIDAYDLLQKSVNEDKSYVPTNTLYSEQYNNYKISQKQFKDKIEDAQKLYDYLKLNKDADKNSVLQAESTLNSCKTELDKFTSDYKLKINSTIEELKSKNKELDSSLNKINDTGALNKEKNKSTTSVQNDDGIKANEEKLKDLEENLKAINMSIEKCTIKASNDGILDTQVDLNIGDVVQAGTIVANILPNESKYKVNLFIADKDIANIKDGQNIKYSFPSLPYKEYGFLNGKVEKISADSKVNKSNGISFYTAESYIDVSKVYSHKGEESEIKNGMTCEAQIVTRKEKMLYYLLEKLNLKD